MVSVFCLSSTIWAITCSNCNLIYSYSPSFYSSLLSRSNCAVSYMSLISRMVWEKCCSLFLIRHLVQMYLSISSTYKVSRFEGWSGHRLVCILLFFFTRMLLFIWLKSTPFIYFAETSRSSSMSISKWFVGESFWFVLPKINLLLLMKEFDWAWDVLC